ncbi:MAG: PEGA domain-containing protein [bacterium]
MNYPARKTLFIVCFLIFIIFCPIILAYSLGYYFDFNNKKIISTGAIRLKSIPEQSLIYVNNSLRGERTPAYLNNLQTGEYKIKVEKENFTNWEKTLLVKDYYLTAADDILLLPLNPLPETIFENSQNFSSATIILSPNKKFGLAISPQETEKQLGAINLSINEISIVSRVDNSLKLIEINENAIEWSANQENFAFWSLLDNGKSGISVWIQKEKQVRFAYEISKENLKKIAWHNENNQILAVLNQNGIINLLNLENGKFSSLNLDAIDFTFYENKIYYINRQNGLVYSVLDPWSAPFENFNSSELKTQFTKTASPEFSPEKNYRISALTDERFLLFEDNILYLVDNKNGLIKIHEDAKSVDIFEKNKMLIHSNHTIDFLDISKIKNSSAPKNELIVRAEKQIKKAMWFNGHHIAYLLEDGNFYITELIYYNGRNTIAPLKDSIENFWINQEIFQNYPISYFASEGKLWKIDWNLE